MTREQKEWIDNASYRSLLYQWRHADSGDIIFHNESGDYYMKIMLEKKERLSSCDQVAASKSIGWN